MTFRLAEDNVFDYLSQHNLLNLEARERVESVQSKTSKNFNLLVHLTGDRSLLVKQEPHASNGRVRGDLSHEWMVHDLINSSPELAILKPLFPEIVHFDAQSSILVCRYLNDYSDLGDYYHDYNVYPRAIAAALGKALADIHQSTFNRIDYQAQLDAVETIKVSPDFCSGLKRLTPEAFASMTNGALKFYELYQRYGELQDAIAHLRRIYAPCCLIHHDLKFNNVLLHHQWQALLSESESAPAVLRLIDWEKWLWGDPALDVGEMIAGYLKIWLKSLVVSRDLSISLSLQLASIPLTTLQPSMVACIQAYLSAFPEILTQFPDFLERVMRFTGLALMQSIQAHLYYYEPFSNTSICLFQVAKTLLCNPSNGVLTVFGVTADELMAGSILPVQNMSELSSYPSVEPCKPQCQPQPINHINPMLRTSRLETIAQSLPLDDLVHNLHILPDGTLSHPDYMPLSVSEILGDRFSHLSPEQRQAYLRRQLRDYIYDIYISHEQEKWQESLEPSSNGLKNDRLRGLNIDFYQKLQQNNSGTGYFDPGWMIQSCTGQRNWQVKKDGLTLCIQPSKHLRPHERSLQLGHEVSVWLPPSWLETGFYGAVGNVGAVLNGSMSVDIYFNLDPEGAIALLGHLTYQLNARVLPFSLKVLIDPDTYDRYDSAILQIERSSYAQVQPILQQGFDRIREHLMPQTPLFMKAIAPGIGLAEEPDTYPSDFGLNRCQILADALLQCHNQGTSSPDSRLAAIYRDLAEAGLDSDRPYLNPGSEDCYAILSF
ncbi:MAG: hypothetical protein EA367_12305 [Leptolyngbya sp. DLM2.Bin15]|nr:MAG: hypothetical protein EA367_12305 [Leptolyngbya sp. DLM2.Bin15]